MVDFKMPKLEEEKDANEKIQPKYVSKDGFEEAKVRRGFTEIEFLYKLLEGIASVYICGGYVRFMCSPDPSPVKAGDVDLYFKNWDDYNKVQKVLEGEYNLERRHENPVSCTYKRVTDVESKLFGSPIIQMIKPIKEGAIVATGTLQEVISNFDFTVIRCGLISPEYASVDADFMHDEEKKILRIKNIHCPISSTLRCMKYARKGYWLPPLQCVRLFLDWENRSEDYRDKIHKALIEMDKGEGLTQKEIEELEALMRID